MAPGVKRTSIEIKYCERCGNVFPRNRKYGNAQWAAARWCSHKCGAWNLGLTKTDDPRMAKIAEDVRVSATGRPGWSKGLTKHTHASLAVISRKVSETQRGKTINDAQRAGLAIGRTWATGRTKENCPSIARRSAHLSKIYTGRKFPEQGARLKAFFELHPEKHPNAILAKKTKGGGYTSIERAVADHLDALGIEYGFNVRVGSNWPDFSIVSHGLLIEADGEHWHQDAAKEAARDSELKSLGWNILHLSGKLIVNDPAECRKQIEKALEQHNAARQFRFRHSAVR